MRKIRRSLATGRREDHPDQLLAFFDCPAEHWVRLRTANAIESTFAVVRHRTEGPASGQRPGHGVQAHRVSQGHWCVVNAPHLVALVYAGATFINGKMVERPGEGTQPEAA